MLRTWKSAAMAATACLAITGCGNQTPDDEAGGVSRGGLTAKVGAAAAGNAPTSTTLAGPPPSELLKAYQLHAPPPLATAADVPRFIAWAGTAHSDEQDDGRKLLLGAAANRAVTE